VPQLVRSPRPAEGDRGTGRERRLLGPGAAFGEIALLTRTATVTALTPCRRLCLNRESFVAAVTGHRIADQVVRETITRLRAEG